VFFGGLRKGPSRQKKSKNQLACSSSHPHHTINGGAAFEIGSVEKFVGRLDEGHSGLAGRLVEE
jgi:hypothetical protein